MLSKELLQQRSFTGSRRSNSGASSRTGSGMSVLSDHRSSPTLGRRDNQGLSSAGIARPNRISTMENYAEAASDTSDQTGAYYRRREFLTKYPVISRVLKQNTSTWRCLGETRTFD